MPKKQPNPPFCSGQKGSRMFHAGSQKIFRVTPLRKNRRPVYRNSAIMVNTANTMEAIPFTVKNAAFSLFRFPGVIIQCW